MKDGSGAQVLTLRSTLKVVAWFSDKYLRRTAQGILTQILFEADEDGNDNNNDNNSPPRQTP
jgi:hypothetical protein